MDFDFVVPTRIVSEAGVSAKAGKYIQQLNIKKALVVTDPGIKSVGLLEPIYESLKAHDIEFFEYSNVKPNPRSEECDEAASLYRDKNIEGIIAIGGGSAIDAAKSISILLTNPGSVIDYIGKRDFDNDPVKIIAIPTTAGTGSEVTFSSVITDEARKVKVTIGSPKLGPALALLDQNITSSLPAHIAASTGVDALTHAIEAYTSTCNNPISDALALHAIRLIGENLINAVQQPNDDKARRNMLVASTIAGMAFGNTDVASVHCISESIGGMYDTPHGAGNAIFLPFVFQHNCDADLERHANVAFALGVDPSLPSNEAINKAVERLFEINKILSIPHFSKLPHVNCDDFQTIAEKSKNNGSDASNAKAMTVESYLTILEAAYNH